MSAAKKIKLDDQVTLKIVGVESSVSAKRSVLVSNGVHLTPRQKDLILTVKYPGPASISALEALIKFMATGELKPTMENIENLIFVTVSFEWKMESALKILLDFFHEDMAKRNPGQIERKLLLLYIRLWKDLDNCIERMNYKIKIHRFIPVDDNGQEGTTLFHWFNIPMFIAASFKSVMFDQFFLELNHGYTKSILEGYMLNISEEEVLNSIRMWINHDFKNRKHHFPELIKCMRYDEKMKIEFIVEHLLCQCKVPCECLVAKDYAIAVLCQKNGYDGELEGVGFRHKKKRFRYKFWKNMGPVKV